MAYGNNYQQGNFNYGRQQGGYQQGQGNYQRQQPAPKPPFNLDEFIQERLNVYTAFEEAIKASGRDVSDFAFALGGWVTSAILESKKG